MKKLIGFLIMVMIVLLNQPVAAQYQSPTEQQYQQEDRNAYLQGLVDGRMGNPPAQNNPLLYDDDIGRAVRNNTRQDPYRQGYDDGGTDKRKNDYGW